MSFEYGFIGWNTTGTSDKVWGYFYRPTTPSKYISKDLGWNCCIFWGARGKAMQFKASTTGHELSKLVSSKRKKGYVEIDPIKLDKIWPTFAYDAEGKLIMDVLSGKVN